MTQDYEEKRSFARMRIETEVSFSLKTEPDHRYIGISLDLSATGLLMHSAFAPEAGSELQLEMHTDNDRLPPFVAEGTVLRVEPETPEPGRYLISIALSHTQ